MKVAMLCENYYPTLGGIQEHVHNLSRGLHALGVEAHVFTGLPRVQSWRGPQDEPWVHRVGKARRYKVMGTSTTMTLGWDVAKELRSVLHDEGFDLVHVHGPCDAGLPLLFNLTSRLPSVATLHSPMNDHQCARHLLRPYYRWAMRRHRSIISVSEAARAAMSRYVRFDSALIPNGVDVVTMGSGVPLQKYKDGRFNVLMLGRLETRNGPDLMFQALRPLVQQHPEVRLLVAGEEKPSGTRKHEAMVPTDLRHHVEFMGAVFEERPSLFATADLCVLPARAGTFSIIMLEALATGCPVVATPFIRGCHEEAHWKPAYISDEISAASLATTILTAVAEVKSGAAASRIEHGRDVVRAFDWPMVAGRVLQTYQEAVGQARRKTLR